VGHGARYLLQDRDRFFGPEFVKQVKAMGIQAGAVGAAIPVAMCLRRAGHRHGSPPSTGVETHHRYERRAA
jgi:hypothetical protein